MYSISLSPALFGFMFNTKMTSYNCHVLIRVYISPFMSFNLKDDATYTLQKTPLTVTLTLKKLSRRSLIILRQTMLVCKMKLYL
jgi:hypothetical protein